MQTSEMSIEGLLDSGFQLQQAGRLAEAERCYKAVLQVDPQNAQALQLWGHIAEATYNHHAAAELMRRSLMIDTSQAEVWVSYAKALIDIRQDEDAIEALKAAVRLRPDYDHAYFNLGVAMRSAGRPEDAPPYLRQALSLKPDYAEAYHVLTLVETIGTDSREFAEINRLLASDGLPDFDRYHLHYALANIYRKSGDKKAFADNLFEANRLQSECAKANSSGDLSYHQGIAEAFTPDSLQQAGQAQKPGFTPVFIVGLPRSGTTLVERILASHPLVEAGEELQYLRGPAISRLQKETGQPYPQGFEELSPEQLQAIAREYTDRTQRLYPEAKYITDKNPGNFFAIGLIRMLMPNARIIALHRDPMDTCFSILRHGFADNMLYCCDLQALAQYYRDYHAQMKLWHKLLPGFVLDVKYEDVIDDQEGQTRRILEFCGLEWDDACLEFYKNSRNVRTLSAAQVRQPIYKSSVGAWKEYREELGPLIEALGDLAAEREAG